MKDRRSLMKGLKTGSEMDRSVEEQFVFAGKKTDPTTHPPTSAAAPKGGK